MEESYDARIARLQHDVQQLKQEYLSTKEFIVLLEIMELNKQLRYLKMKFT